MAKVIFLGTSSSLPAAQRDNTALVLKYRQNCLLIDCPGSVCQKLLKSGIDYTALNKVILTHHHPDHVYGIVHLVQAQYRLNKKITIYTNNVTEKLIKNLIKLFQLGRKDYPQIKFKNIFEQKYFFNRKEIKIRAIKNLHVQNSFGLHCLLGKRSLVYSSDTRPCPEITESALSSDYLIHDCTGSSSYFKKYPGLSQMHTDSKTLAETFKNSKIKKIIPVHFLLLRKGEEARIRKELAPLGRKLFFPNDLDQFTL